MKLFEVYAYLLSHLIFYLFTNLSNMVSVQTGTNQPDLRYPSTLALFSLAIGRRFHAFSLWVIDTPVQIPYICDQ